MGGVYDNKAVTWWWPSGREDTLPKGSWQAFILRHRPDHQDSTKLGSIRSLPNVRAEDTAEVNYWHRKRALPRVSGSRYVFRTLLSLTKTAWTISYTLKWKRKGKVIPWDLSTSMSEFRIVHHWGRAYISQIYVPYGEGEREVTPKKKALRLD